jgi:hypothetical protein
LDRDKSSLFKSKTIEGITYLTDISNDYIQPTTTVYINAIGQEVDIISGATIILTDFIPCIEGTKFIVSLKTQYDVSGCCFYNAAK